ncbi:ABC transporter permease [Pseudoxanthomonas winnipegensis]|uniref:ABC transporter permease n=1 Tax=Pseudoxanthomonas winnipegensis TaxID=2480810 RepID=UPI00257641DB|nr:ABC transporter permease [Pseudoxanthomonas winnipegensis]WJI16255.1 ABC transporter permease [Pseudoxanthomonas winnipegensis]
MKSILVQLFMLARSVVEHRALIWRLAQREVLSKYRGSLFGVAWSLLLPLFMLTIYTFVFTEVFEARWGMQTQNKGLFALAIFSGLIFYTCFAECALKAPGLMLANTSFITKVVFPLELLPIISTLSTAFNALTSLVVLALGVLVVKGSIPLTFLCSVLMLVPLTILCFGMTWVLSALGIYIRDIGLIIAPLTTAMMFLIPVLYPLSQVPERWRNVVQANPLTFIIESARDAVLMGYMPDWGHYLALLGGAVLFALFGFLVFNKARRGFADVV